MSRPGWTSVGKRLPAFVYPNGGAPVAGVRLLARGWKGFAFPGGDNKQDPVCARRDTAAELMAWCERIVDGQTAEESAA